MATDTHLSQRELVHLSYAGFHAGRRLCGVSATAGPRAIFALSADAHSRDADQVCPKCRRIWDRELEEDE